MGKFHRARESESQGFGWANAFHPEEKKTTLRRWLIGFKSSTPFRNEHRLRRKDGEYRYFSISAAPILKTDGSVQEWLWVHTDITERRLADEQTNNALRELNDLKAAIDEHAIVAITDAKGQNH